MFDFWLALVALSVDMMPNIRAQRHAIGLFAASPMPFGINLQSSGGACGGLMAWALFAAIPARGASKKYYHSH